MSGIFVKHFKCFTENLRNQDNIANGRLVMAPQQSLATKLVFGMAGIYSGILLVWLSNQRIKVTE